ncbi:MAG: hypothetical protein HY821_12860, partial [Acidobacteria bacterium]|nr:hypothetical protein [Acidobacteriota bacterium]
MASRTSWLFLLCACASAQSSSDWTPWSARPEIAPATSREGTTLTVSGAGNPAAYGGWTRRIDAIQPGAWYRFSASYRAQGVASENWQVVARIDWLDSAGRRAGQPEYAAWRRHENGWSHLEATAPAPSQAISARLELFLANAPNGRLDWRDVQLTPTSAPPERRIRVASINLRPDRVSSPAESVRQFVEVARRRVSGKADLIL